MSARDRRNGVALVGALLLLVGGCSDDDDAAEHASAQQLVDATQAAGVAPRLTVEVAESLYGTDAPGVCDVFDDGLSTAEENLILGNPAHGRRKTITDDAVTYGGLVVQTYCPEHVDEYQDAVADLDPFERTD